MKYMYIIVYTFLFVKTCLIINIIFCFIPNKEIPFKEIVPIKTSSPIALAMEKDESVDGVRPVADPLLFEVEDEEPIGGDFSKVSCTQQSKPAKESLCG